LFNDFYYYIVNILLVRVRNEKARRIIHRFVGVKSHS
jgi:hypothetical protein